MQLRNIIIKQGKSPLKESESSEESDGQQSDDQDFLADDAAEVRAFDREVEGKSATSKTSKKTKAKPRVKHYMHAQGLQTCKK